MPRSTLFSRYRSLIIQSMKHQQNGKPMRKRLQRQLEFYLSASNLRQDKFLQQHMDADGFLAIDLFLSFRKIQQLQATQRLVLEAALKSNAIRTDEQQMRLAPKEMPSLEDDQEVTERTIYIEAFSVEHDHDSLRQLLARFGKVNLVSMPRFQHSKKFKGFAFIEFAAPEAAQAALEAAAKADPTLGGIRAMGKRRWEELKTQLKNQLETGEPRAPPATEDSATLPRAGAEEAKKAIETVDRAIPTEPITTKDSESALEAMQSNSKPRRKRKSHMRAHLHFDEGEEEDDSQVISGEAAQDSSKKQKTQP